MPTRDAAPFGAPCWIDLFTSNPDASCAFYADLFGWTFESAGDEYGGYINFSLDGVRVAGAMRNDGSQGMPDVWSVYLAVADAEATTEAASAAGAQVYLAPMAVGPLGTMGLFGDPGGAAIGIWQPGEHKGFGILAEASAPSWFELHTRAYDASVAFYTSVFGWDARTMSEAPEFRYTTLGEGDSALAGIMDSSNFLATDEPSHWAVYFGTLDADASCARIEELGGKVLQGPDDTPYGRLVTATDPTGAAFKLQQPN